MITPKYWARAVVDADGMQTDDGWGYHGIGWSEVSQDDAQAQAIMRAQRVREWVVIKECDGNDEIGREYYPDRVLREPVIDELHHHGRRIAAVTRNVYGAFVLNAAEALFIDIDQPEVPVPRPRRHRPDRPGFFARLFGKQPKPQPQPVTQPAMPALPERIRQMVQQHPGMGMKLYRTPNGYRGLVTHRPYEPGSNDARLMLESFQADRLYVVLCQAQQCFRARLTAKPWRIRMDNPPKTFPFTDPAKQAAFNRWDQTYAVRCREYAACEPVSDQPWGNPEVHPDIAPILTLHDELACAPGKPLA